MYFYENNAQPNGCALFDITVLLGGDYFYRYFCGYAFHQANLGVITA